MKYTAGPCRHRINARFQIRHLATILLIGLALTNCKRTSSTTSELQPAPAIDERLAYCLILQARILAMGSLESQSELNRKIFRNQTSRVLASLKADAVFSKSKLPELYLQVVHLNDARSDYLTELAHLSRSMEQRATTDNNEAVIKGGFDFVKEATSKKNENAGGLERFIDSTATGGVSYLQEKERLDKIREQDKQGRLTACETKYERAKSDFTASMEALANVFSSAFKTPRSEFGLDTILANATLYSVKTSDKLVEARIKWGKERPKDPLIHAAILVDSGSKAKDSLDACVELAKECNALVDTVPAQSELSFMRYLILMDAATILDQHLYSAHRVGQAWGAIRNDKALIAASYRKRAAEAYLDETGEDAAGLAWDYFLGGNLEEAIKCAEAADLKPLFQKDWSFCLKMAQLKSLVDKPDDSLKWLTILVERFQYNDVYGLYSDADLKALRTAKPEEFDALLNVKTFWDIDFGWANDDILLTNKSRFPITEVLFKPRITSGANEWNLNLQAKRINAGVTYKWENALSVPGSKTSSRSATISCDQVHAPLTKTKVPKIK
jgi:hypothetical protein